MRSVIYARVATRRQIDKTERIRAQIAICNRYAQNHGYKVVEVFKDQGYLGTRLDRPALNKMRKLIARGSIEPAIAHDLSRLTRSVSDTLILEEELAKRGTQLQCVVGGTCKLPTGLHSGRRKRPTYQRR